MARLFRSFNEFSYSINGVKPEFAAGEQIPASGALAVVKDSPLCDHTGFLDDFRRDHPRRQGL
jgi:hypothetical protein